MAPVTNTLTFTLYSVCFGSCSLCFNKSCKKEVGAASLLCWRRGELCSSTPGIRVGGGHNAQGGASPCLDPPCCPPWSPQPRAVAPCAVVLGAIPACTCM